MTTCTIGTRRPAALLPLLLTGSLAAAAAVAAPGGDPPANPSPAPAATAPDERPAGDAVTGATFRYMNIIGSAFQSRDDTDAFRGGQPGCTYLTAAGTQRLEHKVLLPDGALVKFLRIYYYDTSTVDLKAWLTGYDGAGDFVDLTSATSTGAGGFDSALSPEMDYVVDHYTQALTIVIDPKTVFDGTLQFCGARIAWYAPVDLDTIFKNGFD